MIHAKTRAPAGAAARPVSSRAAAPDVLIRDAQGRELVAGCALLARSLDFSDRDALPPWLVQTSAAAGGLALGAFVGERLAGFSFALPGGPGELFSCGLAVAPELRGRGIGLCLKRVQRARALALGVASIRWTADPLSARALALYLNGLGARLTAYLPELYGRVRPSAVPPDDVEIRWSLTVAPEPSTPVARVEVPLDARSLAADERMRWRFAVRRGMRDVLARGAVGTAVVIERERAWVEFG